MTDIATLTTQWTTLCGTDTDALLVLLTPMQMSLGSLYVNYRLLDPAVDKTAILAVDKNKLVILRDILRENAALIDNCLKLIR